MLVLRFSCSFMLALAHFSLDNNEIAENLTIYIEWSVKEQINIDFWRNSMEKL